MTIPDSQRRECVTEIPAPSDRRKRSPAGRFRRARRRCWGPDLEVTDETRRLLRAMRAARWMWPAE